MAKTTKKKQPEPKHDCAHELTERLFAFPLLGALFCLATASSLMRLAGVPLPGRPLLGAGQPNTDSTAKPEPSTPNKGEPLKRKPRMVRKVQRGRNVA
jgi:hypothetical protein